MWSLSQAWVPWSVTVGGYWILWSHRGSVVPMGGRWTPPDEPLADESPLRALTGPGGEKPLTELPVVREEVPASVTVHHAPAPVIVEISAHTRLVVDRAIARCVHRHRLPARLIPCAECRRETGLPS